MDTSLAVSANGELSLLDSSDQNQNSRSMNPSRLRRRWRIIFAILLLFFLTISLFNWFLLFPYYQFSLPLIFNDSSTTKVLSKSKPTILMWTRVFGEQKFGLDSDCPPFNQCLFTYDHSVLSQADAIIYHVPDIKWINNLATNNLAFDMFEVPDLPPLKNLEGVRNVFLSQENPSMLEKYYKIKDLEKTTRNFFHWTMTYLHSSDFPMPYGGYWVPPEQARHLGFSPVNLSCNRTEILKDKKVNGVLWFVSNCDSKSKRELAVEALAKHIAVTIGGKCAKTKEGKNLCPRNASCDHFFAEHYFYIAAENDICRDYITEKYWVHYHLPAVPIVMRKHIYEGLVPDNSFIAMDQFESPKAMADHLSFLINNPDEYLKFFEWRAQGWAVAPWNHQGYRIGVCGLCERLVFEQTAPMTPPSPNIIEWFERESKCEGSNFVQKWIKSDP